MIKVDDYLYYECINNKYYGYDNISDLIKSPPFNDRNECIKWLLNNKFPVCNICHNRMKKGFIINDIDYYCSDICLNKRYSMQEYNELYKNDSGYYTEWEEYEFIE